MDLFYWLGSDCDYFGGDMKLKDIVYFVEKLMDCKSDVERIEDKLRRVRDMKSLWLTDDNSTVYIEKKDVCEMLEDFLAKKKREAQILVDKEI